eukprot:gnl/TRDRNA2_/TRDRNA2_114251_c0_seq1.p2 gnl/TRDRNA2_/TRDRNA2_114251_c0~~gnl/TRDRNA2_/TRDRNA2_114251_c0_seq1.p2  ORF type:complete len:138 (-),score=10.16 gnl/TRDRNA2_/TRDRNA2_114251_c0_seq1:35-448(-)
MICSVIELDLTCGGKVIDHELADNALKGSHAAEVFATATWHDHISIVDHSYKTAIIIRRRDSLARPKSNPRISLLCRPNLERYVGAIWRPGATMGIVWRQHAEQQRRNSPIVPAVQVEFSVGTLHSVNNMNPHTADS